MGDETPEDEQTPRGKVERVIQKYGLEDAGNELADRWTTEDDRGASLRELETYFNVLVLKQSMEAAGLTPLEGEVENLYRLLTSEETSSGARTQAERRLERADIDVDALRSDFVTHQAIHTYLTKHRGVTNEQTPDQASTEDVTDTVRRLVGRTRSVTRNAILRLRDREVVTIGKFDVTVDVRIYCADCGTAYGVTEFLERKRCECEAAN